VTREKSDRPSAREPIRFRIVCRPIPPKRYLGHATVYGVRHRDGGVVPGKAAGAGAMRFTVDAEWSLHPRTGRPRFYGPFVFDAGGHQALNLRWTKATPPHETIEGVKVHLETIDPPLLERLREKGGLLETKADIPPWGAHQRHGLGVGQIWQLKQR
jgi:Family of unknown function (DUF5990)